MCDWVGFGDENDQKDGCGDGDYDGHAMGMDGHGDPYRDGDGSGDAMETMVLLVP